MLLFTWVRLCVQQERLDIEEKYSSLQEEVAGKTKKLKKVWTMYMQAKSEVFRHFTLTVFFLLLFFTPATEAELAFTFIMFQRC